MQKYKVELTTNRDKLSYQDFGFMQQISGYL